MEGGKLDASGIIRIITTFSWLLASNPLGGNELAMLEGIGGRTFALLLALQKT